MSGSHLDDVGCRGHTPGSDEFVGTRSSEGNPLTFYFEPGPDDRRNEFQNMPQANSAQHRLLRAAVSLEPAATPSPKRKRYTVQPKPKQQGKAGPRRKGIVSMAAVTAKPSSDDWIEEDIFAFKGNSPPLLGH
eukprot:Rmarinus@m.4703